MKHPIRHLLAAALAVSSLAALAQSGPKAVLLRLEPASTTIVGALEGRAWVAADALSASSQAFIKAGTNATLLGPTGAFGRAKAGGAIERYPETDPCDWVRTTGLSTTVRVPAYPAYAIAAAWNPVPRPIQALPTGNATYRQVIADELKARKVNAEAILAQALKVDLDGDRTDEVILVAQRPKLAFGAERMLESQYETAVNDYSLVLVRELVAGKLKTFTLGERVVRKRFTGDGSEPGLPTVLTQYVSAIADVDGDGRMEIFLDDYVHEGLGVDVLAWTGTGFKSVISWGCGV